MSAKSDTLPFQNPDLVNLPDDTFKLPGDAAKSSAPGHTLLLLFGNGQVGQLVLFGLVVALRFVRVHIFSLYRFNSECLLALTHTSAFWRSLIQGGNLREKLSSGEDVFSMGEPLRVCRRLQILRG